MGRSFLPSVTAATLLAGNLLLPVQAGDPSVAMRQALYIESCMQTVQGQFSSSVMAKRACQCLLTRLSEQKITLPDDPSSLGDFTRSNLSGCMP
jgi:hypothetical protein